MSNSRPLEEVTPTNVLKIGSRSCEEKAAHVRNKAVQALQQNDAMEVGYRFLQSRKGRNSTRNEAMVTGFFAVLALVEFCKNPGCLTTVAMLFYVANIYPNISNRSRYQETENACGEWLRKKFGEQEFNQIQNMPYNKKGLDSLTLFLRNKNIAANEKKHEDIEIIQNSIISFAVGYLMPEAIFLMLILEIWRSFGKKPDPHQTLDINPRLAPGF